MTQCRPINLIKRKWRADRAHRASTLSVPLSFSYRVLEAILECPAVSVTLLSPRVAGGVRLAPGCPVSHSLGSSLFSSDSCSQQAFSRKHSFCPQFTLIADFSKPFSSLPHRPSHADPLLCLLPSLLPVGNSPGGWTASFPGPKLSVRHQDAGASPAGSVGLPADAAETRRARAEPRRSRAGGSVPSAAPPCPAGSSQARVPAPPPADVPRARAWHQRPRGRLRCVVWMRGNRG